jgi:hypothetical protein
MKKQQIDTFESIQGQLQSLYVEMLTLSKKSPTDVINKFKLKLINSILQRVNEFLGAIKSPRPLPDFTGFEDESLPSNSDVVVIISQYLASLEKIRADNIKQDLEDWYWIIEETPSIKIRTAPPVRITNK